MIHYVTDVTLFCSAMQFFCDWVATIGRNHGVGLIDFAHTFRTLLFSQWKLCPN